MYICRRRATQVHLVWFQPELQILVGLALDRKILDLSSIPCDQVSKSIPSQFKADHIPSDMDFIPIPSGSHPSSIRYHPDPIR